MAIDTTVGGALANSYASVEEADLYFTNRYHVSFWDGLTKQDKEKLLITCTALLDWYVTPLGLICSDTQALKWPRENVPTERGAAALTVAESYRWPYNIPWFVVPDTSDIYYSTTEIPYKIKVAVYELIVSFAEEDTTDPTGMEGIDMAKLGSMQIKMTDKFTNPARKVIPERVWCILSGLCYRRGSVVFLQRG